MQYAQNKDPYQPTSIVSFIVCEMHHGFGTLLFFAWEVCWHTQIVVASKGTEVVVSTKFRIIQPFAVRPCVGLRTKKCV